MMEDANKMMSIIKKRRSIRKYQDRSVERKKIISMVKAAKFAPSASNSQPWRFFAVEDSDKLEAVVNSLGKINSWAKTAPLLIIGCSTSSSAVHYIADMLKGIKYYMIDLGIAMEHMVLAATEMGLATCWVGWFDERKIKKILDIPSGWKVVSVLAVGYADENLRPRAKKTLSIEKMLFFK
jgi:nitroreductase